MGDNRFLPKVNTNQEELSYDKLLDEFNNCKKRIRELQLALNINQIEITDSENKDQQINSRNYVQLAPENPLVIELIEKEKELRDLLLKMEEFNSNKK